jgi:hypothetical protein
MTMLDRQENLRRRLTMSIRQNMLAKMNLGSSPIRPLRNSVKTPMPNGLGVKELIENSDEFESQGDVSNFMRSSLNSNNTPSP